MTGYRDGLTIGIDASRAATKQPTGTERYSRRIIEEVTRQGARHRFRLYLNTSTPLPLPMRACDQQRLIPWPRVWTHTRLSAEMLTHPVDVLFIPAHVVPLAHPHATVVTIHDLGYLHEPDMHGRRSRAYLDWSTRWSVRAASRIIAVSDSTRADLVERYRVPEENIAVVYHGIDEQFQPAPDDQIQLARAQLGIQGDYVLYVGTLQPRKNLARLIAAFDLLAEQHHDLSLVLVGKWGWLPDSINQALADARNAQRILLAGHVPDELLPALYSGARVFALPSLFEGFGLPALEAMRCGTPVVVSNRGALPEVTGDAAEIVDPLDIEAIADGLRRALQADVRAQMIPRGLDRAAQFQWQHSGRQTLEVLEAAAHESRR